MQKFNIANNDKSNEDLGCLDVNENGIYNELGDLNNWEELIDPGDNVTTKNNFGYSLRPLHQSAFPAFLELNDLDRPLTCPAKAGDFELAQTGSTIYRPPSPCINLADSWSEGDFTNDVLNVSELNQHYAQLEGSHWQGDHVEAARKVRQYFQFTIYFVIYLFILS